MNVTRFKLIEEINILVKCTLKEVHSLHNCNESENIAFETGTNRTGDVAI